MPLHLKDYVFSEWEQHIIDDAVYAPRKIKRSNKAITIKRLDTSGAKNDSSQRNIIHLCFFKRYVCDIINGFFARTDPHNGSYMIVWDSSGGRTSGPLIATYRIYQDAPDSRKTLQIHVTLPRSALDDNNMDHLTFAGCILIAQQLRRFLRRTTRKTADMIVVSDGYAQSGKNLMSNRFRRHLTLMSDVFGDDLDVTHLEIDCIGHKGGYNKNNPRRETREHVACDVACRNNSPYNPKDASKPIQITVEDSA